MIGKFYIEFILTIKRPLVLSNRKNWIYLGNSRTEKAMANHMTLIQSCRTMNINLQKYLEFIYRNLM